MSEVECKVVRWGFNLFDSYLNMMLFISNKDEVRGLRQRIKKNEILTKIQKKELYKILDNKEKSLGDDDYCIIL
jgi:hypothetical protein